MIRSSLLAHVSAAPGPRLLWIAVAVGLAWLLGGSAATLAGASAPQGICSNDARQASSQGAATPALTRLPVRGAVRALHRRGETLWVGRDGLGLSRHPLTSSGGLHDPGTAASPWVGKAVAPSTGPLPAVGWQAIYPTDDPATLWLGTGRGAWRISEGAAGSPEPLAGPAVGEPTSGAPKVLASARSSRDGSILWLQQRQRHGHGVGLPSLHVWHRGRASEVHVTPWDLEMTWTALAFDEAQGCWLAAGHRRNHGPTVVTRCGSEVGQQAIPLQSDWAAVRLRHVAADPLGPGWVVALSTSSAVGGDDAWHLGRWTAAGGWQVLRESSGPIAELLTDPQRRVVWVVGQGGLSRIDGAGMQPWAAEALFGDAPLTAGDLDAVDGSLWLGTAAGGVYRWTSPDVAATAEGGASPRRVMMAAPRGLPPAAAQPLDARPGRVLMGHTTGVWEMALDPSGAGTWRPRRSWQAGEELPEGFYGLARFLADGSIAVARHGHGVMRLTADEVIDRWLPLPDGRHVHHLWPTEDGGLWLAILPGPLHPSAVLERYAGLAQPRHRRTVRFASTAAATLSGGCLQGDGSLWLATGAGVVEVPPERPPRRHREGRTHAVACGGNSPPRPIERRALVALAGTSGGLSPTDRIPRLGAILDERRTAGGRHWALFAGGWLGWLQDGHPGDDTVDAVRRGAGLLGPAEGLSAAVRRLVMEPRSGAVLIGTAGDGTWFAPSVGCGQGLQGLAAQAEGGPSIHGLGAEAFVEPDSVLVPVQDAPIQTTTVALDGELGQIRQQELP